MKANEYARIQFLDITGSEVVRVAETSCLNFLKLLPQFMKRSHLWSNPAKAAGARSCNFACVAFTSAHA